MSSKKGMQNQGRDHEIFETGFQEGVRGIDDPQILHKPAWTKHITNVTQQREQCMGLPQRV